MYFLSIELELRSFYMLSQMTIAKLADTRHSHYYYFFINLWTSLECKHYGNDFFTDMPCLLILNGEKWWMWKISLKYQLSLSFDRLRSFSIIKIKKINNCRTNDPLWHIVWCLPAFVGILQANKIDYFF